MQLVPAVQGPTSQPAKSSEQCAPATSQMWQKYLMQHLTSAAKALSLHAVILIKELTLEKTNGKNKNWYHTCKKILY